MRKSCGNACCLFHPCHGHEVGARQAVQMQRRGWIQAKGPGKGIIVRGQGWVSVDKSNYKQYNF